MKNTILLPLIFLLCFACKKKDADPPQEEPTPAPAPVGTYYGVFSAEKFVFFTGGMPTGHTFLAKVFLHTEPKTEEQLYSKGENFGLVKSDGINLQYNTSLQMYHDPTASLTYTVRPTFQHTSTTLGSINYTSADSFPQLTAEIIAQLEDTLDKSKDYIVPLTKATYFSHASCTLYDGSNMATGVTKTATAGASGFTFTPSELKNLKLGQQNFVNITLKKQNDQTLNGKLLRFENKTYGGINIFVK